MYNKMKSNFTFMSKHSLSLNPGTNGYTRAKHDNTTKIDFSKPTSFGILTKFDCSVSQSVTPLWQQDRESGYRKCHVYFLCTN